jgi:hypothetical protein
MAAKAIFTESNLAKYVRAMKESPRELIFNRRLLLTAALYAMSGIPISESSSPVHSRSEADHSSTAWDQGSSSVVPSLPGFVQTFGINSVSHPTEIANFISYVYIGAGVGAGLSFFINDRIGRLWSFRLYMTIWVVGQLIATFSNGHLGTLYAARIVSGLGIGPLTVIGPVAIVEIAPTEIRGLLAVWFSVVMLLALTVSTSVVLAVFLHVVTSRLQYQIVWFAPTIAVALIVAASFVVYESPRWLFLVGRDEEAIQTLVALRGLPADHPRVAEELVDIRTQVEGQRHLSNPTSVRGVVAVLKETFLVPANLRRVQQALVTYALAQLSGANSVTSYLVPILGIVGVSGGTDTKLFLSCMYSMSKFFYTLIGSFFIIDALGRRKSLFTGATIQMISDLYIGIYLKYHQAGAVSESAGQAAIAAIFIHGFGYAIGE